MNDDDHELTQRMLRLVVQDPEVFDPIAMMIGRAAAVVSHVRLEEPLDDSMAANIERAAAHYAGGVQDLIRRLHGPEADDVAELAGWPDGATLRRFVVNGVPPQAH